MCAGPILPICIAKHHWFLLLFWYYFCTGDRNQISYTLFADDQCTRAIKKTDHYIYNAVPNYGRCAVSENGNGRDHNPHGFSMFFAGGGVRGGTAYGRDRNPNAMTIWMAGGGCKAGHTIGATDELGMAAVEGKAHVRDFHVTLLRLLGLDDNKLSYYHGGRFKQLSQFGGEVIKDLIA